MLTLFWVSQTWLVAFLRTDFSSSNVLPDSNETELGSRDQQHNSPSSPKNLRLVCSTAIHMEVCIYSLNPSYWRGMEVFNIGFIGGMSNFFFTDRDMDLKQDNLIQEGQHVWHDWHLVDWPAVLLAVLELPVRTY